MKRRLAALLVGLCAASAQAGWWDDAGAARRATLEDVRRDPDRWRDVTIVMDVRFARLAEPGNAYFTRFTAKEWRAAAVAAAGADGAAEAFEHVFVRRGSAGERRLGEVAKGGRVQIRGAVRDAVRGEPWIEVFDVVADGDPLTPEEEATLARGADLLARANPAAAETVLRGLVTKRALPRAVQADVWRRIGAACWAERRFAACADAWAAALEADPADAATAEKLAAAKSELARPPKSAEPQGANRSAASVGPSAPTPPAAFGTPIPAPRPRAAPPAGLADAPKAAETPAPPADETAPPAPPKPKLAGPK